MLFVFFFVQPGKRFVQLGAIGIVFYSAFEEILAERKIIALRLYSQRQTRLVWIVHGRDARVPGHVPCRRVPKQQHPRLQCGDVPEQQQHPTPLGVLPCRVHLDKKGVGDNRTKPAQGGDESELPKFFAQIEIELDAPEMFLPV